MKLRYCNSISWRNTGNKSHWTAPLTSWRWIKYEVCTKRPHSAQPRLWKTSQSPKVDLVVQTCYYNLNVRVFFPIIEQPREDNACEN